MSRTNKSLFILLISALIIPTLIPLISAQENWAYNDAQYDLSIKSGGYARGNLKDIEAKLSLKPNEEDYQKVLSIQTNPKTEDNIFRWDRLDNENFDFSLNAKIKRSPTEIKIKNKIKFPIRDQRFIEYTDSSQTIDSNDRKIKELAEQLATGEDDLFIFTEKVAAYVEENVKYTLDSVTEKAAKPASWVLENKIGVCDELTNLFIAVMRASGVPARFVSGVAYTDSKLFKSNWGPHGWAEVYFPDYGWIPVDVTYKEIGWLDTSHIKLKDSLDATDPSVSYKWKGDYVVPEVVLFEVNIDEKSDKEVNKNLVLKTWIKDDRSGFGSYNNFEVELTNKNDYYLPANIRIAKSESIELIDDADRIVLLKPGEIKKLYFKFKTKDNLDPNFKYTSYLRAEVLGEQSTAEIISTKDDKVNSKDQTADLEVVSQTQLNPDHIDLSCTPNKDKLRLGDTVKIICDAKNNLKTKISDLDFCIQSCTKLDFESNQVKTIDAEYKTKRAGKQDIKITLSNKEIFKIDSLPIDVVGDPEIKIVSTITNKVGFNDKAIIEFTLAEIDEEILRTEIEVRLNNKIIQEETVENLQSHKIIITVPAKNLKPGKNTVSINVKYSDRLGQEHKSSKELGTELTNLKWWQTIVAWLNSLF